jgi:hypothetical protein
MRKSRIRLLAAVLLPVILMLVYTVWREGRSYARFTQYFGQVTQVMRASADSSGAVPDTDYRHRVTEINREIAADMERIYRKYEQDGDANMAIGIRLSRGLFDELFRWKTDFAAAVEPLLSEPMLDRKTLSDEASYAWRVGVLDEVERYLSGHDARGEQIIENFRQAVADSDLPEKYKKFVWWEWARDLADRLADLGPGVGYFERQITGYRRLFAYLYKYPDLYYVGEDGRIIIRDEHNLKEYQAIAQAVGQDWM